MNKRVADWILEKWRQSSVRFPVLLSAIALLLFVGVGRIVTGSGDEAKGWRLRKELSSGHRFFEHDLELAEFPRYLTHMDMAKREHLPYILKSQLSTSLRAGDFLRLSHLILNKGNERPTIGRGYRAYSIRVDNGHWAKRGDTVDIFVRPKRVQGPPVVVVEAVEVLERADQGNEQELTLALPQREVTVVEKALQIGKLSIALIGADEKKGGLKKSRARRTSPRRSSRVEVLNE